MTDFEAFTWTSPLKGVISCNWFKKSNFLLLHKLHPNIEFFEEAEGLLYEPAIED